MSLTTSGVIVVLMVSVFLVCVTAGAVMYFLELQKACKTKISLITAWVVYVGLTVIAIRLEVHYLQPSLSVFRDFALGLYVLVSGLILLVWAFSLWMNGIFEDHDDLLERLAVIPGFVFYGYIPALYLWDHVLSNVNW